MAAGRGLLTMWVCCYYCTSGSTRNTATQYRAIHTVRLQLLVITNILPRQKWSSDTFLTILVRLSGVRQAECEDVLGCTSPGLAAALALHQVHLVCIMAGTNDLPSLAAATTKDNLNMLHRLCHDSNIPTIAIEIPESNFSLSVAGMSEKREDINDYLLNMSERNSKMAFLRNPVHYNCDNFCDDGLHFSQRGYGLLAHEISRKIDDLSNVFQ